MNKQEYKNFLKSHDAIRINNYVIHSYTSYVGWTCYGAFHVSEIDGGYYINERPEVYFRDEKALQRCIDFAITKK